MSKGIEKDRRSVKRLRPEEIAAVIVNSVFEVVLGALICTGVMRFFAALFSTFPESLRLALVPYASATLIFCLRAFASQTEDISCSFPCCPQA